MLRSSSRQSALVCEPRMLQQKTYLPEKILELVDVSLLALALFMLLRQL